ncbi:MAG: hypothetical protein AAFO94_01755, partial [Bacteroidota bacterium]
NHPNPFPMKEQFQSTQTLYYALVGGPLMMGLLLVIFGPKRTTNLNPNMIIPAAIGMIVLMSVSMSVILYRMRLKNVQTSTAMGLEEKITAFRSNSIMRWALLEGAALCSIILYFLEGNYLYLIYYCVPIVVLIMARPTIDGFIRDYQLNHEQEQQFRAVIR